MFVSAAKAAWRFASRRTPKLWLRLGRAAPYRGIPFCSALATGEAPDIAEALPIRNRRYGAARWSRNRNGARPSWAQRFPTAETSVSSRDSRVGDTLGPGWPRSAKSSWSATILADTDRLQICATLNTPSLPGRRFQLHKSRRND